MTTATLLDGADWAGNIFVGGELASRGRRGTLRSSSRRPGRSSAAPAGPGSTTWPPPPPLPPRPSATGPRFRTPSARPCSARRVTCSPSTLTSSAAGTCARSAPSRAWPASRCTSRPRSATPPPALPGAPLGELIPSEQPRLSMAKRVPAGVVGVISPFNVPLILSIRSVAPALALGNAVLLKPDPRTVMTGGVNIVRVFEEAGLPAGVLQLLPGGADVGEALVADPHVRVISFTGLDQRRPRGRRARRASPQARAPRARRELRDARARRRRRREGGQPRRLGLVLPPGPDLHDHRAAPRARRDLRRLRRGAGRQGRPPAGRQPGHRGGRARPGHRRGPARQDPRPGHGEHRRGCEGGRRCVVRRAVLPPDRALRGDPRAPRLHRGDLRAGRPGDAGRQSEDEAVELASGQRVRPLPGHRHRAT